MRAWRDGPGLPPLTAGADGLRPLRCRQVGHAPRRVLPFAGCGRQLGCSTDWPWIRRSRRPGRWCTPPHLPAPDAEIPQVLCASCHPLVWLSGAGGRGIAGRAHGLPACKACPFPALFRAISQQTDNGTCMRPLSSACTCIVAAPGRRVRSGQEHPAGQLPVRGAECFASQIDALHPAGHRP